MGLFDWVEVEVGEFDIESDDGVWQTKHRDPPFMETFRLDDDGLWLEDVEYETVPEEDRNDYGLPIMSRNQVGWEHWDEFHGLFEFHGVVDGEYRRFKATFTHGELESIDELD